MPSCSSIQEWWVRVCSSLCCEELYLPQWNASSQLKCQGVTTSYPLSLQQQYSHTAVSRYVLLARRWSFKTGSRLCPGREKLNPQKHSSPSAKHFLVITHTARAYGSYSSRVLWVTTTTAFCSAVSLTAYWRLRSDKFCRWRSEPP